MTILNFTFACMTFLLGIPVLWFCIQIVYACLPSRKPMHRGVEKQVRVAVLIPAHNESINLLPTLQAVLAEKNEWMRVVVVADNCSDDTAAIASQAGVEVIERINAELRGKGYALDFGIQHLQAVPPQVVIILDADCIPEKGILHTLATQAVATSRPVQALYLMKNPDAPALKAKIAEFAWVVKNHVRPKGMCRLGLPCHLTGSGMAFSWDILQKVSLATGNIVEDMKLGMTLATLGHPPLFSENTLVTSHFPSNDEGVKSQRTRWEHGHLSMLWSDGLPNVLKGILDRDKLLLFLALDLCIPPLALLVTGVLMWCLLMGLAWIGLGSSSAFLMSLVYLVLIAATVLLAWMKFGRNIVTGRELLMAPVYVFSKLHVYGGFVFRRQAEWVRSKRDNETK